MSNSLLLGRHKNVHGLDDVRFHSLGSKAKKERGAARGAKKKDRKWKRMAHIAQQENGQSNCYGGKLTVTNNHGG